MPIEPTKTTDTDRKLRDGTFVRCGYCAMHLALVEATKQIAGLRAQLEETQRLLDKLDKHEAKDEAAP